MSHFDRYIEDYLLYHFRNMPNDSVPRDYETESNLMLASKCEHFLQCLHQQGKLEDEVGIAQCSSPEDKVQYKITRHSVQYYNSTGDPKLHHRTLLLFDAFEITCNVAVRLPLLELYCKINDLDCIKTATNAINNQYANELNELRKGDSRLPEPLNQYKNSVDETYHNWSNLDIKVLIKYFNNKKIILPLFFEELSLRDARRFCFWPTFTGDATPLYSNAATKNKDAAVILTEEFELAASNQQILSNSRILDIEWQCYWPQQNAQLIPNQVADIDWSKLKNRKVYYLLKGGSGTDRDINFKRARVVESKLDGIVKDFKYVSLFKNISEADTPDTGIGIPIVLSPEELTATLENKYQQQRIPLASQSYFQDQISFVPKGDLLLSPIIRERSVSVLYGNEYNCRSWFALCMAFFMAQGQKVVEGWTTGKLATPALYLYGDDPGDTDFRDKLDMAKAIYKGRAKAAAQRYKRKEHILGINANKVHPINNNFHGEVIEHNAQDPYEILSAFPSRNAIDHQISLFEKRFQNQNRLLVLDNIFSAKNEYALANIGALLARLKKRDWAVIIVDANEEVSAAKPKKNNMATYKNKLSVNNLVRINHLISEDITKSQMSIKLKMTYRLKPDIDVQFKCELDTASEPPTFRRLKQTSPVWGKAYKMRREKLKDKIKNRCSQGFKGQAIADELQISLSLVKKLRVEIKKEEQIVYVDPKSKKQ